MGAGAGQGGGGVHLSACAVGAVESGPGRAVAVEEAGERVVEDAVVAAVNGDHVGGEGWGVVVVVGEAGGAAVGGRRGCSVGGKGGGGACYGRLLWGGDGGGAIGEGGVGGVGAGLGDEGSGGGGEGGSDWWWWGWWWCGGPGSGGRHGGGGGGGVVLFTSTVSMLSSLICFKPKSESFVQSEYHWSQGLTSYNFQLCTPRLMFQICLRTLEVATSRCLVLF